MACYVATLSLSYFLLLLFAGISSSISNSTDLPETTVIIDYVNPPWIFVPIGADNVTSLVLQDQQPWVLYFHSGLFYEPLREAANRMRGLVGFGLVHRSDTRTAEILGMDPTGEAKTQFRALPFGSEEKKLTDFLDTDVFDAAADHASQSVPGDSIVKLAGEATLGQLLSQAVESDPSKFIVIFTIRDATPTLLHRVLSKKLAQVYSFGLATRIQPGQPLDAVGLPGIAATVPGMLVVQPRPDGGSVDVARLEDSEIATPDELTYAVVLRYLVEYNRQFRAELPGRNRASDASVVRLTGLLQRERLAFNIVDWMERHGEELESATDARVKDEI